MPWPQRRFDLTLNKPPLKLRNLITSTVYVDVITYPCPDPDVGLVNIYDHCVYMVPM